MQDTQPRIILDSSCNISRLDSELNPHFQMVPSRARDQDSICNQTLAETENGTLIAPAVREDEGEVRLNPLVEGLD